MPGAAKSSRVAPSVLSSLLVPAESLHARMSSGALPVTCHLLSCSGVSLSFLFSWLLILWVFATFLVGGNVQTLVCKNWANQEIYKVGPCFLGVQNLASCRLRIKGRINLHRQKNQLGWGHVPRLCELVQS